MALGLLGGAVLVVDLRLLNLGLRKQSTIDVARSAQPWLMGSLATMLLTGVLLFTSESIKCYYSPPVLVQDELSRHRDVVHLYGSPQSRRGGCASRWTDLG